MRPTLFTCSKLASHRMAQADTASPKPETLNIKCHATGTEFTQTQTQIPNP
jgi:hypothetical protein